MERDLDLMWDLNMGMRVGRRSGSVWLELGRPEGWGCGRKGTSRSDGASDVEASSAWPGVWAGGSDWGRRSTLSPAPVPVTWSACSGHLITRICPDVPSGWGSYLLPLSALVILLSQETCSHTRSSCVLGLALGPPAADPASARGSGMSSSGVGARGRACLLWGLGWVTLSKDPEPQFQGRGFTSRLHVYPILATAPSVVFGPPGGRPQCFSPSRFPLCDSLVSPVSRVLTVSCPGGGVDGKG